ncbi:M61 family metallopeptidase [Novosphingobium album (ex Liu et al. 2023)]|uniref:Peptidase M61 n=1 Tax=Novosphingobium album (ex Liu et al. 2023) TaxID=3031130 RepID=A0ABT5WSL5_9SPHN|nr:peptidase M61 [Novosphingobium album (ex Liu et al. 2023)]MDE8653041.1 peptidase M61 [Novosphingobium album (ex Liu et al. 2023)]
MRSALAAAGICAAVCLAVSAAPALSQGEPPAAAAPSPPVPDAVDSPWPGGAIRLDIDASDTRRGLFRVVETIPVAPGTRDLTLLFPQWLPGNHAPRGPLAELVDLRFFADGKPIAWKRDPVDVYAFRLDLPAGTREVTARFIHTSPLQRDEGRITMTQEMLNLQWEKMSLYPAGHYVSRIRVRPSVTLPADWTPAAALDGMTRSGSRFAWDETDYETLVDSPIFAGAYFRSWDLGHAVRLSAVADAPELLTLRPADLAKLTAMVDETLLVFGKPAFDHYEFLVALSNRIGGIGLEHLRSSEDQLEPRNFAAWDSFDWDRNVLPHEFAHSWNGKYRRPDQLWTPDYRTPMRDNLLWVYEGQTQFWGLVLAARSGVQGKDVVLGAMARAAGSLAEAPGRGWRSVEDTTFDPVFAGRKPKPYASLSRGEDYYWEGALVWLEADQVIREGTGGRKGLDDFAAGFFSHAEGTGRVSRYGFGDVVAALDAVYPYDWAAFLQSRIDQAGLPAPLAGIEKAGYRLVWREEPNAFDKARMDDSRRLELWHSLGMEIEQDGTVADVRWDGPAFRAGIVSGARIVAVDSLAYDAETMRRMITDAKSRKAPLELLVRRGDRFLPVPIDYHGGLRWPWLQRAAPGPEAPLDRLLAPRRG